MGKYSERVNNSWKYVYEVEGYVPRHEPEVLTLGEGGLFFYEDGSINDVASCMSPDEHPKDIKRVIKITVEVIDDRDC
jgi:hypothetical protein